MVLSTEILNFHVRFIYLVEYFNENQERFSYKDEEIEMLNGLWDEWTRDFRKYTHPLTFGDINTGAINDLYEKCYKLVTSFKIRAVKSIGVEITSEDKCYLEVNTNTKTRGKIPVTDYAPNLVCLEIRKSLCKFFAMDPKHLGTKRKPEGADKVGILIAYKLKDEPEPKAEEYKKINPEKKSIFEVLIPADKSGMVMYIKVYFISPTGEEGKPSAPLMVKLL